MVTGSYLLNNLCEETWYILPSVLKMYEQVLNSKFVDNKHFDSLMESGNVATDSLIEKIGSKAIVSMEGTMVRKAGFMDAMCGMVGMDQIGKELTKLSMDSSIDHVILNWDSPGGSAIGTPELANIVHGMRNSKRITSLVSGGMCSAGYFIGSAAHEIYSTSPINSVGSIGVVTMHVDQSEADKAEGLKYTYIYSGKHKVDGNPHEALSSDALSGIQKSLDYTYGIFLDAVSMHRGISREELMAYAEGQVFNAGQLLGTPMLDGIATLDEILRS